MTRILITGAAGFIGSHLTRYLLATTDWQVVALDRLDEAGAYSRLAPLLAEHPERLRVVWHNLRAELKYSELGDFDYCAHLAAGSHVERSTHDPLGYVYDNVVGTAHVLEYFRRHSAGSRILYFSTDEIFGPTPDGVEFDEHARHEPENHYAATKSGAEQLCPAYAHQCGLKISVTHCCNVYGPNQHAEKFIPLATRKILNGETVQIHSRDGRSSSRLYIHVDDVCRAVLRVLQHGETISSPTTGRYNIRADEEISNNDVAREIARVLDYNIKLEYVERPAGRLKPDMRYALSDAKLRALGWQPRVDFWAASGLRATVDSIRAELKAQRGTRP